MKETLFKYQSETSWMWTHSDYCNLSDSPDVFDIGFNLAVSKKPYWKKKQKVFLTSGEMIKEYYGDQTKSVFVDRVTFVVEEKENSVGFKLYEFSRGRRVGSSHFGVTRNVYYVTYNKKYGNFYSGFVSSSKKKRRGKRVLTNNWSDIRSTLSSYVSKINDVSLNNPNSHELNTNHGWDIFYKGLDVFISSIYGRETQHIGDINDIVGQMYSFFMKSNGVSVPDGFDKFINMRMGKRKLVKKGSVVDFFMETYNLKGRKIRKILNEKGNFNLSMMVELHHLLGVDHFNKLMFTFNCSHQRTFNSPNIERRVLTNSEKNNIIQVMNEYINTQGNSNGWNTVEESAYTLLMDHLRFKDYLWGHGEMVKIKSKNLREFNREHSEWSNLLDTYKNGYIDRVYSGMMKKELEQVIIGPHMDYYPVLLTNSDDYNEESTHQKNCVRTYVEQPNCFIISIREGSEQGKERATVEYKYFKGDYPKNVQALGRFNDSLSSNWNYVLEEMSNRVRVLSEKRVITLPKMKKIYKNGKEVVRQSYWNKRRLMWDNTDEYNDNVFDLFY